MQKQAHASFVRNPNQVAGVVAPRVGNEAAAALLFVAQPLMMTMG
jgi:hypothetical protein